MMKTQPSRCTSVRPLSQAIDLRFLRRSGLLCLCLAVLASAGWADKSKTAKGESKGPAADSSETRA